jgi:hypothetical protein
MITECSCEDRPCCDCGQEYLAWQGREEEYDRDEAYDRLMTDDSFYDRVVGW